MTIGTFSHTWKVTSIKKVSSVSIANTAGISTSYTDFITDATLELKTTNSDYGSDMYLERPFDWHWRPYVLAGSKDLYPVESTYEPENYIEYQDLTANDVACMLGEENKLREEQYMETQFTMTFAGANLDKEIVTDPFSVGIGTT